MTYATVDGVRRKITTGLYDETELDLLITDTDIDVISWVNSAVRRTVDFTEDELTSTDDVIRLASDCYCAFRIMSEQMEGHDIKSESLARVRFNEAKEYIRMWCAVNDVIPSFDDIYIPATASADATTEVGAHFATARGTDAVCIRGEIVD